MCCFLGQVASSSKKRSQSEGSRTRSVTESQWQETGTGTKLQQVFVQNTKCISTCQTHLSKNHYFLSKFHIQCICPNCKMYFSKCKTFCPNGKMSKRGRTNMFRTHQQVCFLRSQYVLVKAFSYVPLFTFVAFSHHFDQI